jgi:hypothetical protein
VAYNDGLDTFDNQPTAVCLLFYCNATQECSKKFTAKAEKIEAHKVAKPSAKQEQTLHMMIFLKKMQIRKEKNSMLVPSCITMKQTWVGLQGMMGLVKS